jgi:glutathione S-transferase
LPLLHEVGASFETHIVNVRERQQFSPDYLAINPKGKVPALRTANGQVVTEFPAIAYWIAESYAKAGLWPDDVIERTRTLEALDFIVASVHMRGFTFVKVPQKFHADPQVQQAIRAQGRAKVEKGITTLSRMLADQDYLLGSFSIADAGLFYLLEWAAADAFALPENLGSYQARLHQKAAFARARGDSTRGD